MQSQQQKVGMGIPADRSARSIFVGNISYDVNEEEIKKIFSACGQIIGFRLMYDRDTGRPKGFGFCEFTDVQHAEAAIRNFNGYELHGRQLRVDSATGNESEVFLKINFWAKGYRAELNLRASDPYNKFGIELLIWLTIRDRYF
ncbi:unnamed protein product [Meloidogyne enterolobii]|uniref:Uncharacterized protein n=1 Tax=Meloidogyne enterolobii TaxID=390850 RepID=A0ACB0YGK6_MELEN